jgi:intracellular sulfur oxidation DsrE/DsrF family protein
MFKLLRKFISPFKKKPIKELTQKQKQNRALEYVDELIKSYNWKMSTVDEIGSKMGYCMNSMEMMKIKAQLLTNQIVVTDKLLFELERSLMYFI